MLNEIKEKLKEKQQADQARSSGSAGYAENCGRV